MFPSFLLLKTALEFGVVFKIRFSSLKEIGGKITVNPLLQIFKETPQGHGQAPVCTNWRLCTPQPRQSSETPRTRAGRPAVTESGGEIN